MSRKPNANSVLKTLPPERQAAIVEFAGKPGGSLAKTVAWLAEDGIQTNSASLSEFLSWYALEQQFQEDASTTESLLEQWRKDLPNLTEEQLDDLGQRTFSLLAIRRQDPKTFVMVRSARTRAEQEKAKIKLREQAEARAVQRLAFDQEKFKEGVRTKLESGLAELAQYIKGNAKAQAAYETFKAEVKLATK